MLWKPCLKTFSDLWQHVDEDCGQEDASAEAHEPGHEVLHPLHPLRLQQPDQQQGGQSAAQLDEAKEDEDDDFRSDEVHPVVNVINILWAAFAPIFFCQKITKPN